MSTNNSTFTSTIKDGFYAALPVAIVLLLIRWLWRLLISFIQPVMAFLAPAQQEDSFISAVAAILFIGIILYIIGILVTTEKGSARYSRFEMQVLRRVPGYLTIKEMIATFSGEKKASFSKVALVQTFHEDLRQIAFITDEQRESYTVFVPTGPNPTSGNIFILPKHRVQIMNVSVESAMKTIIGCGTGASSFVDRA